jgi:hypothetical protein
VGQARAQVPAQRVGLEDGARRTTQVVVGDAADEARHVDAGGQACMHGASKQYRQRSASTSACVRVRRGATSPNAAAYFRARAPSGADVGCGNFGQTWGHGALLRCDATRS